MSTPAGAGSAIASPTAKPDADGWTKHDRGPCPVPVDTLVDVRFDNGTEYRNATAGGWGATGEGVFSAQDWWQHQGETADNIIAYRISPPADAPVGEPAPVASEEEATAIYTASKTTHASKWRKLRAEGWPINSTWIDEAGKGETACFAGLWQRCVSEAQSASAVLLYREPDEILKGAFIEAGAALSCGVPVHAVGCEEFSFVHHPLVTQHASLADALAALSARRPG